MTHISVYALSTVVGVLVPFLTGFVGRTFSGAVRSVLNALLSAVAGGATIAIANNGNVSLAQWILGIGLTWGASVVSYHGLLAPTGAIDAVVEYVAKVLAKVGITLPVKAVETDLEALVTELEAALFKKAAVPVSVNVSVSGTGTEIPTTP